MTTMVCWVRSYWIRDGLAYVCMRGQWVFNSERGAYVTVASGASDYMYYCESDRGVCRMQLSREVGLGIDHASHDARAPGWTTGARNDIDDIWVINGPRGFDELISGNEWRYLGFGFRQFKFDMRPEPPYVYRSWTVGVPHWFIILITGPLPLRRLLRIRRRRQRRKRGLCVNCGYDLRASPDRCPECGTPVPAGFSPSIGAVQSPR
jgi:hypothetical protein